jgi:DNA-binding helix-hairpin-helix protein with protein kinase domain
LAVQTVHDTRAVIGDFQERNILVSDTARVTLVDCDSMQFTDTRGRQYLCGVARAEFTAPELSQMDLRVSPREKSSDLFALAVHIHLLLMGGNHPFLRGNWTGLGEQPSAVTLAKKGQWAGGPSSQLRSHPLAPSVTFLPDDILRLFARAFTIGAREPSARPAADEWRRALLAVRVTECQRGHQIPAGGRGCPWCSISGERTHRRDVRKAAAAMSAQQISHIGVGRSPTHASANVTSRPSSNAHGAQPATGRATTPVPRRALSSAQRALLWAAGAFGVLAILVAILIVLNAQDRADRHTPPPTVTNTITRTTPF